MQFYRYLLFSLILAILVPSPVLFAGSQEMARPLTFSGPRLQVDDLSANFHSDGKILVVSGKIKNLSYARLRGYITIYLRDSHQDVLRAVDVEINKNQPILSGQAARFETTANIEGIQGLANVSIEFVETNPGVY